MAETPLDPTHPGRKLNRLRLARFPKLSQREIAELVGKSKSSVQAWEEGRNSPSTDDAAKIGGYYGVPVDWFFNGKDDDPPIADAAPEVKAPRAEHPPLSSLEEGEEFGTLPYAGLIPASNFDLQLSRQGSVKVPRKFTRKNGEKRFVCRVLGASCAPYIFQGDYVILEADEAPVGGVFVIAQNSEHNATLKVLDIPNAYTKPQLRSPNPDSEDPYDLQGWTTVAKLVGLWRDHDVLELILYKKSDLKPGDFPRNGDSDLPPGVRLGT